jgi:hypothetical protein
MSDRKEREKQPLNQSLPAADGAFGVRTKVLMNGRASLGRRFEIVLNEGGGQSGLLLLRLDSMETHAQLPKKVKPLPIFPEGASKVPSQLRTCR